MIDCTDPQPHPTHLERRAISPSPFGESESNVARYGELNFYLVRPVNLMQQRTFIN